MIGANEESVPPDIVQTEIQRFTAVNFKSMEIDFLIFHPGTYQNRLTDAKS
jgi:hypothetical protein